MGDYVKKVKQIISVKAGVDVSEISKDDFFEEDLNIGELELIEILSEIEDALQVNLMDKKNDIECVQDLVDILAEKLE